MGNVIRIDRRAAGAQIVDTCPLCGAVVRAEVVLNQTFGVMTTVTLPEGCATKRECEAWALRSYAPQQIEKVS